MLLNKQVFSLQIFNRAHYASRSCAYVKEEVSIASVQIVIQLYSYVVPSLVSALLYSLCIHKIGLRIYVHNFLSDFVTACSKSRQKTRVTNLLGKVLQDIMHEMIDKNYEDNTKNVSLFVIDKGSYLQEKPPVNIYTLIHMHVVNK